MTAETLQSRMSTAALRFLESLEPGQRDIAHLPFSAVDDRETWFYTPTDHGGLILHEMTLRPLGAEEDLGRELVHLLTREQQRRAIISPVAARDIVTSNRPMISDGDHPLPTNNLFRAIARPDRFEFWQNMDKNLIASLGF